MRAVVVVSLLLVTSLAHAEGTVSARTGYYKERSTRVVQPMIDADLVLGESDRLSGHVLVDSITSASAAAGSAVEFTERRYEGGVGWTHDLGRGSFGLVTRASTEDDYTSYWAAVTGSLLLFEKNTTLSLTLGRGYDTITNGVVAGPSVPAMKEHMSPGLTSLSLVQLLGPRLVGTLAADFMDLHGYQANIYRRVFGAATPAPERVPDLRLRLALSAGVRWYLPSATTVIASYRFYDDDWGIVAHTAETRVVQELVPGLELRGRYRFYTQTAADFWDETYDAPTIMDPTSFITDDEKLGALTTHTVGGQLAVSLGLFGLEGSWATTRVDLSVEHVWQDDLFGNAWVAQAGVTVPFDED